MTHEFPSSLVKIRCSWLLDPIRTSRFRLQNFIRAGFTRLYRPEVPLVLPSPYRTYSAVRKKGRKQHPDPLKCGLSDKSQDILDPI